MQIDDQTQGQEPQSGRGYVLSMVVSQFRGYEDVEIHLFRSHWEAEEEADYDWEALLGEPMRRDQPIDPEGSRRVFLETFSLEEKDALIEYLHEHYADRVRSIRASLLPLPIPIGLTPLSSVAEDQRFGRIRLHKIPHYSLGFAVEGLYSLTQHKPSRGQDAKDAF
ncbi:hypothetical protein [Desulfovermiculus halophilus]|uniref:hypothetical protein n=1 Tax=Desulfovermiculus halophilus TaxID=339722 RepID=UPI0004874D78|nr:hypothetical protein [Desulfovermiculus halophilus]